MRETTQTDVKVTVHSAALHAVIVTPVATSRVCMLGQASFDSAASAKGTVGLSAAIVCGIASR